MSEVHFDRIVGRLVRDADGAKLGRLADVVAQKEDGEVVVASYIVAPRAWVHRCAVPWVGTLWRFAWFYRVTWDQMDLSDPQHPRATCGRDDLTVEHVAPRKRPLTRRPGRRLI
jgi:hypothetical protein